MALSGRADTSYAHEVTKPTRLPLAVIGILIMIVAASGPLLPLPFSWARENLQRLEPGTWTELVGGLATAGALVLTAIALGHDRSVRRRDVADREAAQASSVAAWFEWSPLTEHEAGSRAVFFVRNASNAPVYETTMSVRWDWDVAMPDPFEASDVRHFRVGVVPPTDTWSADVRWAAWDDPVRQIESPEVAVAFTDSAGHRWRRDSRGNLLLLKRARRESS